MTRMLMLVAALLLLMAANLLLARCAPDRPEPKVMTEEVKVAVPVPCHVDTHNQRPALMTLAEVRAALAAANGTDAKAKIVTAQLLAYIGWTPVVEGALSGCDQRPR